MPETARIDVRPAFSKGYKEVTMSFWRRCRPFFESLREKHKDNPEIFHAKVESVLDKWTDIMIEHIENGEKYFDDRETFTICDRVAEKIKRIYEGKRFTEAFKMWPGTAKIFYQMAVVELMVREMEKLQDDGGD